MSDLFLDLRDKPAVVDFLVEALEYTDLKDRKSAEAFVKAYQEGEKVHTDKLAEAARDLAIATWASRYALRRYLSEEGSVEEWRKVLAAVRPSTANLLKRFRDVSEVATLDQALAHAESDVALHEEERLEIEQVRTHVRHDIWRDKHKTLIALKEAGVTELEGYMKRLKRLRDLAIELPRTLQDEVFSKIAHYEDRILFDCELVPMELLDGEIAYYVEQKELSPLES